VWSAFDARFFTTRLIESRFEVTVMRVRAHSATNQRHVLWLARRTAPRRTSP